MASFYHFYHLTFTEWISLSSLHTPFSQCHHFLSFSLSGSLSLICSADSAHSFCIISMICDSSLTFTEWISPYLHTPFSRQHQKHSNSFYLATSKPICFIPNFFGRDQVLVGIKTNIFLPSIIQPVWKLFIQQSGSKSTFKPSFRLHR